MSTDDWKPRIATPDDMSIPGTPGMDIFKRIGIVTARDPQRVMVSGVIMVEAAENVREGDRVVILAEGKLGGGRIGTGRRSMKGAFWEENVAKGKVGRIRLGVKRRRIRKGTQAVVNDAVNWLISEFARTGTTPERYSREELQVAAYLQRPLPRRGR